VAVGPKLRGRRKGGGLGVIPPPPGKPVYNEAQSSPPQYPTPPRGGGFLQRGGPVRPGGALFLVETPLRPSRTGIPMLQEQLSAQGAASCPARVKKELWAMTPHLYAVNAQPDLMENIGRAVAEGLRALAPPPP